MEGSNKMNPTISIRKAKRILASVWFLMAGLLFVIVFIQTLSGYYGDKVSEAWAWLLPTIMPTLSLIIAVLVSDSVQVTPETRDVSRFIFVLAISLSTVYLLAVMIVVLCGQLTLTAPLELMKTANLGLGPLQGLVVAAIGIFFVKKGT